LCSSLRRTRRSLEPLPYALTPVNTLQILLLTASTLLALATAAFTRLDRRREHELTFRRDFEARLQAIANAIVEVGDATELHQRRVARLRLRAALASMHGTLPASDRLLEAPIEEVPQHVDEALDHVSLILQGQARAYSDEAIGLNTPWGKSRSWLSVRFDRD